jgi:uncharacterized HhH-GPD family protein
MAQRVQALAGHVVSHYHGNAAAIWLEAQTGEELLKRLMTLPGFGRQKSQIFVALLAKQLDVRPGGWMAAAGDYAETGSFRSVADVRDPASLDKVRAFKRERKARAKAAASPEATPGAG